MSDEKYKVEQHIIKCGQPYYDMFCDFTHKAKNLYNHATYLLRNAFINEHKIISYDDLYKILANDTQYPDYYNLGHTGVSQQILKRMGKDWKSFFKAIKDWKKNKSKYTGKPNLPGYKKKNGKHTAILTNQAAVLEDNIITFPRCLKQIKFNVKFNQLPEFKRYMRCEIIPKGGYFIVSFVYEIKRPNELKNNKRYMGIDIGIDNLLTVATNNSGDTFIINGKGLKSINKYSNKFIAHYTEIAKRMNDLYSTKRLDRIYLKRRNKINDFLHKTSKYIVDYAFKHEINTIIIGNNKGWKQDISYTSLFNQTFQQIPFKRLIKMIKYKAEKEGINVIVVNESYTSGTSFLDEEKPTKKFYDKSRRKYRGLFISNEGKKINADVNAALQIIKKYTKQSSFEVNKSIFNPRIISIS